MSAFRAHAVYRVTHVGFVLWQRTPPIWIPPPRLILRVYAPYEVPRVLKVHARHHAAHEPRVACVILWGVVREHGRGIRRTLQILDPPELPPRGRDGAKERGVEREDVALGREDPLGVVGVKGVRFVEKEE